MDVAARMSSKGQVTVPKTVRDALDLEPGDAVVFRVTGNYATLARTQEFLDLAGTFAVPPDRRDAPWEEIVVKTRASRGSRIR